jgi:molecular chaperone GrpE
MSEPQVSPSQPPTDNGSGDCAPPADLESLQVRLRETEQDRDKYLEMLQRTTADFDNYQKRVQRDREQESRYGDAPLALAILSVVDNLDRAMLEARKRDPNDPLVKGIEVALADLHAALKRRGIVRMEPERKPFDPNLHQAVMQQPSADHPVGTVLQVLQQGWMIHDRVLRPAAVIVSVAPAEQEMD